MEALADACISACTEFFSRAREHTLNREIEFIEIIDVLRETVRKLAGESEQFNQSLIGSSERFHNCMGIDDLQALREVLELQVTIDVSLEVLMSLKVTVTAIWSELP